MKSIEVIDEPLSLSTLGTLREMNSVVLDMFVSKFHFNSESEPNAAQLPVPFKMHHYNYTLLICDLGTQKCWFKYLGNKKETLQFSTVEKLEEVFIDDGWPQFVSYFNYGTPSIRVEERWCSYLQFI